MVPDCCSSVLTVTQRYSRRSAGLCQVHLAEAHCRLQLFCAFPNSFTLPTLPLANLSYYYPVQKDYVSILPLCSGMLFTSCLSLVLFSKPFFQGSILSPSYVSSMEKFFFLSAQSTVSSLRFLYTRCWYHSFDTKFSYLCCPLLTNLCSQPLISI